jgi:hypothetical protein
VYAIRVVLAAVLLLACLAPGVYSALSPRRLDVRSVCPSVTTSRTVIGSRVVMDVVAADCSADARIVQADLAMRLVGETWRSLRLPVDEVRVRVRGAGSEQAAVASRADLIRRYGFPEGAAEPGSGWHWLFLPVGCVVYGVGMFWFARFLARRGVFILLLRK